MAFYSILFYYAIEGLYSPKPSFICKEKERHAISDIPLFPFLFVIKFNYKNTALAAF